MSVIIMQPSLTCYSMSITVPFCKFWFENDTQIQVRHCHLLGIWFVFINGMLISSIFGPPASARRVLSNRICASFHPFFYLSFHLSVSFLGIGSLVFSESQHGVMGPCIVVSDRAGFFGKKTHQAKMTRNGEKWHKNMVFGLFKKITSLVLSGICVK